MNTTYGYPAGMCLACAFPPARGFHGASTTIADIATHGLPSRLFTPNRRAAVSLVVKTAMEAAESTGHGNAAQRRAMKLGLLPNSPVRLIAPTLLHILT